MPDVTLTIKNQPIVHPKESLLASDAIAIATQESDQNRVKASLALLIAAVIDTCNTLYYSTSTVLGTVKRFPTVSKKEAKEFLIQEGIKALTSAVYVASCIFISVSALYDPKWALSHIQVKGCEEAFESQALLKESSDFQEEYIAIKGLYSIQKEEEEKSAPNYFQVFKERYEADFGSPSEVKENLVGMKKVIAAIAFMRDCDELARRVPDEYENVQIELFADKLAADEAKQIEMEEARKQSEESVRIQREQDEAYQRSLAIDKSFSTLEGILEGYPKRLESLRAVSPQCLQNAQDLRRRVKNKFAPVEDHEIVEIMDRLKLTVVDLTGVDLTPLPETIIPQVLVDRFEPFIEIMMTFEECRGGVTEQAFQTIQARLKAVYNIIKLEGKEGINPDLIQRNKEFARKCEKHSDIIDITPQGGDMEVHSLQRGLIRYIALKKTIPGYAEELNTHLKRINTWDAIVQARKEVADPAECGKKIKALL